MNVESLKIFCAEFPGVTETLSGHPSNILVYAVGGKTFSYFKTSDPERWRFSTRVASDRFLEMTDIPGVKPARYMGRFHWVTIVRVEQFQQAYLAELVEWSYRKALNSLGKHKRLAIGGSSVKPTPSHGMT